MPEKMQFWRPKVAPSICSEEAVIRPVPWEAAQDWCNFVLLRPESLPSDLWVEEGTLRAEAPPGREAGSGTEGRFAHGLSNRASYQFSICGPLRKLVIKEFFYDLGPPAWDHPAFWLNTAVAFEVGQDIGWAGTDFQGRPAFSVRDR